MSRLLLLLGGAHGCSNWIMPNTNVYGLSGRTTDLATAQGLEWAIMTQPVGHRLHPEAGGSAFPKVSKYGFVGMVANASIGFDPSHHQPGENASKFVEDRIYAGINTDGLTCDCQTLEASELAPASNTSKDLNVLYFCQWALASFNTVDEVRAVLTSGSVHVWGVKHGIHTHHSLRDASGRSIVVEYVGLKMQIYDDLDDGGKTGFGVMTNDPPYPYMVRMVQEYETKRKYKRPSASMPGDWYADSRFLRLHLVKEGMRATPPRTYREAVQQAVYVLNTVTAPPGDQIGTGEADAAFESGDIYTQWGVIYDHKQSIMYWRTEHNSNMQRVRLADVNLTKGAMPEFLLLSDTANGLPWFNDASGSFGAPTY